MHTLKKLTVYSRQKIVFRFFANGTSSGIVTSSIWRRRRGNQENDFYFSPRFEELVLA